MIKSRYTKQEIEKFISNKLNEIVGLRPVVEGMDSQVYSYTFNGLDYIIRINPNIEGFKKDEYAYKHFNSDIVPIPKVVEYGKFNDTHYYCISEMAKGITYEDSPEDVINRLLPAITLIKQAINSIDISNTTGYGTFDSETGNAPYNSWYEYISKILNKNWEFVKSLEFIDEELIEQALNIFSSLLEYVPETRCLLHGDFGNNNIMVEDGKRFSAVIDWDEAGYGDPLKTVASAYFWSNWLLCADRVWNYWKEIYKDNSHFDDIVTCYALRSGLNELYENAIDVSELGEKATKEDFETIEYVHNRMREILNKYLNLSDTNRKYYKM